MNIEYLPATDDDYDLCEKLHNEGMRPYCEPLWGWCAEFQKTRYKKLWSPQNILTIIFEGKCIGYYETHTLEGDLKLENIFINKNFRGNGFGAQVLTKLLAENKNKFKRITLNVLHNNPASNLYKKMGFKFVKIKDQIHEYEYLY